jgi:hypothetical protein
MQKILKKLSQFKDMRSRPHTSSTLLGTTRLHDPLAPNSGRPGCVDRTLSLFLNKEVIVVVIGL